MEFSRPRPRRLSEPALPMINVVFLLLIFFLMSAQIAPPPPFDVAPPRADGPVAVGGEAVLYIAADGALAFGAARGEAAWPLLNDLAQAEDAALLIRADAGLDATRLAQVLGRLSGLGLADIRLATVPG